MINPPDFFKYFGVISIPLFTLIALLLIKKASDFSFKKHTISKTVLFLKDPGHMLVFRFNFIIKSLLDLGFVWYLIFRLKIIFTTPLPWMMILSIILFGSAAYFIVGKHTVIHKIVIYGHGVLWAICQIFLAQMTGNVTFIKLTFVLLITVIGLAFGFLFAKKTNVFVQAICIILLYGWLLIFVSQYL